MFQGDDAAVIAAVEEASLLNAESVARLMAEGSSSGIPFAQLAVRSGMLEPVALLRAVAEGRGWDCLELAPAAIAVTVADGISPRLAERYQVVPLRADAHSITVLAANPYIENLVEDLEFSLQKRVVPVLTFASEVDRLRTALYGACASGSGSDAGREKEVSEIVTDRESKETDPSVRLLVERILEQGIREAASDIHFEPFEKIVRVRYRVGGALVELHPLMPHLGASVAACLKVMADLDLAERRVPQDGRMQLTVNDRVVDLRISTLPTEFGESVVLRVLDRNNLRLNLEMLSMPPDVLQGLREVVRRPHGILIATGPTGSGKTTTLYSTLAEVNDEETKILTAEDPVEYEIRGIVQTPIRSASGLGFAEALRAFLRQDPDKILVGEIRDAETAHMAVQASLTGHLVLSTLHTNDAPGAVVRLIDMGIEPFLLAATLEAVLAQRLLRKICLNCRRKRRFDPKRLEGLGSGWGVPWVQESYCGSGCTSCHQSGYDGRWGIFEWMILNDRLRGMIHDAVSVSSLTEAAREAGMRSLLEEGIRAVEGGRTTVEEVMRAAG